MAFFLLMTGFALFAAAIAYALGAVLALRPLAGPVRPADDAPGPVSVFKPLCGAEPGLYESLRGYFTQTHPRYQLLFGVRNRVDPALEIIARLRAEFPGVDVAVVADPRVHGQNLKVSNLINMAPHARHPIWVIADSDIRVSPDYLMRVTAPLGDPALGAVTALYAAERLSKGLPGALAALHIEDWFLPSVLVARRIGKAKFCLGSTIAVRRETLESTGGFHALKDFLADDYMLGALLAGAGKTIELAPDIVTTTVTETSFAALIDHELRWARTIKSVEPVSYVFSFLMHTVSVSLIAAMLIALSPLGWTIALSMALTGCVARMAVHGAVSRRLGRDDRHVWLVPLRDLLSFAIWVRSFAGRSVEWRGRRMTVDGQGVLSDALGEGTP